jgi:hypothetical protein
MVARALYTSGLGRRYARTSREVIQSSVRQVSSGTPGTFEIVSWIPILRHLPQSLEAGQMMLFNSLCMYYVSRTTSIACPAEDP